MTDDFRGLELAILRVTGFGRCPTLFYSEDRNEKETDRRAHYLSTDIGDGEEVSGIRKTGFSKALRCLRCALVRSRRPPARQRKRGRRIVLGLPPPEDQRLERFRSADSCSRITPAPTSTQKDSPIPETPAFAWHFVTAQRRMRT
jgi:hypothetical protein